MERSIEDYYFKFMAPEPYKGTAISRLYRAKITQIQMMRDRQYEVPAEELEVLELGIVDFIARYQQKSRDRNQSFRAALNQLYVGLDGEVNQGKQTYVYYPDTPEDKKQLSLDKDFVEGLSNMQGLTGLLVISDLPLSAAARKVIAGLKSYHIQDFLYTDLDHNVTQHFLVPEHDLMTAGEKKGFLSRNKLKLTQNPVISVADPIARYYGAREGQMFKIHRQNLAYESLVPDSLSYRVVLDRPLTKD